MYEVYSRILPGWQRRDVLASSLLHPAAGVRILALPPKICIMFRRRPRYGFERRTLISLRVLSESAVAAAFI